MRLRQDSSTIQTGLVKRSHIGRSMVGFLLLPIIAAGLLVFQPAGVARAATITVTTTADEMVNNATCSLREAIIAANTNSNAHEDACAAGADAATDTITLAANATYALTISGSEDAAAAGDLDLADNSAALDLFIRPATGSATISQDASPDDRVLHILDG